MDKYFQFVGGPYDGREFVVPGHTEVGLELRVYPVEPWVPGSSYLLGRDGRFLYNDKPRDSKVAAGGKTQPEMATH